MVLATVCSIFGLYIIGLVFARKADKKDEMKVGLKSQQSHSNWKIKLLNLQAPVVTSIQFVLTRSLLGQIYRS